MKTSIELLKAIDRVRGYKMTSAERFEQRVSFVYGSMSSDSTLTKDEVRAMLRGYC